MAKYMFRANYTRAGVKGLLAEGGTAREAALRDAIASAGGTLEGFYYAFGDCDLFLIAEMPDAAAATGLALNLAAGGGLTVSTTVLLSAQDLDRAVQTEVEYRAPGA